MAQQQQPPTGEGRCSSEADELADCAAQFGNIDVGACLSCVSTAIVMASSSGANATTATTTTCRSYNATFCTSIQSDCQASCDDYRCGAEFSLYYLCEADANYKNVTAETPDEQGLCDINCGSIGNSSDSTGTDTDTGTGTNNGTAPSTDDGDSSGNGGNGGNEPGSCNATWNDLRMCLVDQGRDASAQQECDSCIQDAIPISDGSSTTTSSVDCSALNEQYCNAVTSCETVCARAACAAEFDVQLRCAAEVRSSSSSSGSNCQITSCGSDATSAAALSGRDAWMNRLGGAAATLAAAVVVALAS
jgi:hypothetical protein